jgi:DNA-binding transcriptional MerR regulator/effector-binding domain-containing protein
VFKIGEFSKLTQVSVRMLRYYDEAGLLKPAKIDEFTGYRLYSVEQIRILHKIIFLRDTGFNVSEIAIALSNWDNAFIIKQLKSKRQEIELTINQEQERLSKIDIAMNDIMEEKISIHYNVSLKSIPSYGVLSLRKIIPNYFGEGMLWEELYDFIKAEGIDIPKDSSNFAVYHDVEYKETDVDVEVCVVTNAMGENKKGFTFRETERVETMACAMVYGPFENIAAAYETFAHWLVEHNQYRMLGLNRQICHRGPWNEKEPDKYLTEIQIPVEKTICRII